MFSAAGYIGVQAFDEIFWVMLRRPSVASALMLHTWEIATGGGCSGEAAVAKPLVHKIADDWGA